MVMDLTVLIEKRKEKIGELEAVFNVAKIEKRKLSAVEDEAFNKIKTEINELDKQIDEKRNKNNNNKIITRKMENKFRLTKAIEARANGRSIDEYAEILEAGKKEMIRSGQSYTGEIVLPMEYRSDILAGTQYQGQEIVTEDKFSLLGPLRDRLILAQAGANIISGLVGDVSIPVYAGTSAAWKGEVVAAADGAGAFSEVTLSPKRLTAYIDVSKQFLAQDSISADQLLMSDMVSAVADKLQETILSATSGTTQPTGILFDASDVSGTSQWAKLVNMEKTLREAKVFGPYSFLSSPSAIAVLKTTSGATSSTPILVGSDIMGYRYDFAYSIASNHIILANWSDLIIGQWGGFDLIVDPYSVAKEGKVRLVINTYWDAKFRRSASYCVADLT
jgi:HK97 family phage major capsid protein